MATITYIYNPFTGNLDAVTTGLSPSDITGGSPNTVAGFDASGVLESIPLWAINPDTGGLYQNLAILDSVNPGSPTTHAVNNAQFTISPSADVGNLNYMGFQNHAWLSGAFDILGYQGFSNTLDLSGTGDKGSLVAFTNSSVLGTGGDVTSISDVTMITNNLTVMDFQTIAGNINLYSSSLNMASGSVLSNSFTGIRLAAQVDAGASTGDMSLFDLSVGYDGTLTTGNIRMGSFNGNITSALPGGSGATGLNLGYNLSNTSQFLLGMNIGHNIQSGGTVSGGATQGYVENIHVESGGSVNNVSAFISGTWLQSGGTITGGYEGFKASPSFEGTMTGTGANSFISAVQMSVPMNYYSGFIDQATAHSGTNIANTFNSFTSFTQVQSGATVNDFTMFQGSPGMQAGSTVTSFTGFRANVQMGTNLSSATLVDLNAYDSGVVTNLTGINVNLSAISSPNQKIGLQIQEGSIQSNAVYLTDSLPASPGFISLNGIGGLFNVKPAHPTSSTLVLGSSMATNAIFQDNMGPDGFGGFLGFVSFASVSQLAVETGKTVDTYSSAVMGASVPDLSGQGITGGGTITNANVVTAFGIQNGGASVAITNLKGLNIVPFFNSFGATNAWGVWVGDSSVDNYFAKDVVIGGSTGKPIGSEALTVNGSMAMAGATSGEVTLSAAAVTTSYSLVMPNAQGAASTVLTNDGSGNLSWAAGGGGPTYTAFAFSNNQVTPANVTGFSVNSATNHGFAADMSILRIMSNVPPVGSLDTAFVTALGTGFNSTVQGLAVIPSDSSIVAGGAFATFNGTSISRIVKMDKLGIEDATFTSNVGSGFNDTVRAIAVDSTDRILIGGSFGTFNGNTRRKLVCLSSAGVEDSTFTTNLGTKFPTGASNQINSLAIQSDDAVVAVGAFPTFNGGNPARIVRLNSDGTEDTTFSGNLGTGLDASASVVAIQPSDQKILVGGSFLNLNGSAIAPRLIRLNTDGTLDTTFDTNLGTGFDGEVRALAVQADGKIVVSGSFTTFNGNSRNYLVRLNSDGTEDSTFYTNLGTGFDAATFGVLVQAGDDKIIVVGSFTQFNGNGKEKTARLNPDGTEDTAFSALMSATQTGITSDRTIVAQSSGAVLLGGSITNFQGMVTTRLVELNVINELDQTFTFYGTYSNSNLAWKISDPIGAFDDAGVDLSITAGGQLQYISSDLLGTSVTQSMRWMIRGL